MIRRPLLALGASVLLLAACDNASVKTEIDTSKITYARDARTNICFAVLGRGESAVGVRAASFSMTTVPCSPEVMAQIARR